MSTPQGTILITSASSGIGAIYADRGQDLIFVARSHPVAGEPRRKGGAGDCPPDHTATPAPCRPNAIMQALRPENSIAPTRFTP